jgi:hypothetical protein
MIERMKTIRMTTISKLGLFLLLSCGPLAVDACAQAVPAGTTNAYQGFQFPSVGGSLSYALTASETYTTGYNGNGGNVASTNFSGDLAYVSTSERHPFSAIYSGGYLVSNSSNLNSSVFQSLSLSQVVKQGRWNFIFADSVSYLPESPTAGLSGIPGLGDLGVDPTQTGVAAYPGAILSTYQSRVSNVASGSVTRSLTGSTSLLGTGSYAIQRFVGDGNGFDNDEVTASGGISHRINQRNTLIGNYSYNRFNYSSEIAPFSFSTQGVNIEYVRLWTRRLTMDASIGPQFSSASSSTGTVSNLAAALSFNYVAKRGSATLGFTRGTSSGSGVVPGTLTDSINFGGRRSLTRVWTGAATIAYTHATSLSNIFSVPFTINGVVASSQISRGLGRYFSFFASYTLERQSTVGLSNISSNAFSGLSQIIGFGITYSPSSFHLAH